LKREAHKRKTGEDWILLFSLIQLCDGLNNENFPFISIHKYKSTEQSSAKNITWKVIKDLGVTKPQEQNLYN
jgi:hypothetical protein